MANVNEAYQLVNLRLDKDYSGSVTPEQFNLAFPQANYLLYNQLTGILKQSLGNQTQNNMFYSSTTKEIAYVDKFIVGPIDLFVPLDGKIQKPANVSFVSSARHIYYNSQNIAREVKIEFVDDAQLADRLNSEIVPPTNEYPIMVEYSDYFQFFPQSLQNVKLTYLRLPVKPVWAYTVINGEAVYDPTNSVNSEFPDECMQDLVDKTVVWIATNIKDYNAAAFSQGQQGNDL